VTMHELGKYFMLDMLICIIPKLNPDAPTVGPAVLKSHLNAAGFSCEVVDFNIRLYNELTIKNNESFYYKDDYIFTMDWRDTDFDNDFKTFYIDYEYVFLDWIETIKQKNPRYVGLSLLSVFSQAVAVKLSQLIRTHLPNIKIVWGGAAVEYGIDSFKDRGLMDHYISGDGEFSVVELLKGNLTFSGIDSIAPNQVLDLNKILLPDYDDINWDEYVQLDTHNPVYITGSRGCVKKCTFCNVRDIWPEYRFRSGESIAEEIISVKERYDRYTFKFTDSLINGSMKSFRRLLTTLSEYRKSDSNFMWSSQWVIRSKSQSPESDYAAMKASGCKWLEIGVESFSQDVRYHMGKKFTDDDLWWCLEMLQKYEIPHVLLMIIGYPTETEEDHQHTLASIQKAFDLGYAAKRDDGRYLLNFSFGNTLMLTRPMPLWDLVKDEIKNYKSNIDWDYKDNTLEVRIRRFNEVNDLIKQLKNQDELCWLTEKAISNYDKKLKNQLPNDKWYG
jgi:radical SAM superfamily enzyme YgiQ (UPF0313 family)